MTAKEVDRYHKRAHALLMSLGELQFDVERAEIGGAAARLAEALGNVALASSFLQDYAERLAVREG